MRVDDLQARQLRKDAAQYEPECRDARIEHVAEQVLEPVVPQPVLCDRPRRVEAEWCAELGKPRVDRTQVVRVDRGSGDVGVDQHPAQTEPRHRVIEHLERRVRVLPRNRREAVEAAAVLSLCLRPYLVEGERDLLRPLGRKPVDVAERRRARDDGVDPRALVDLELPLQLVEMRADREPVVRRELKNVAVALAPAARVLRALGVGVPEEPRVPVGLAVDDSSHRATIGRSPSTSS